MLGSVRWMSTGWAERLSLLDSLLGSLAAFRPNHSDLLREALAAP
ncbi:MAG: hypothetical protein ACYTBJ_05335 [Planctomycetota bacterium]